MFVYNVTYNANPPVSGNYSWNFVWLVSVNYRFGMLVERDTKQLECVLFRNDIASVLLLMY